MEQAEFYLDKMLEFEERGEGNAAITLGEKLLEIFPDYKEKIFLETGKLKFRMERDKEALLDFVNAYEISGNQEIYELILEAYFLPNKENFIELYEYNLELLKEYPYYENVYPEEELRFFPIWQDEELLICVDILEKNFAMNTRCEIKTLPQADERYLMLNEMWQETIFLCEENCRMSNPFMDVNIPMYLVYDRVYWILFLQLYSLKDLIKRARIVFLVGMHSVEKYFDDMNGLFPTHLDQGTTKEYIQLLEYMIKKQMIDYDLNYKIIKNYYSEKRKQIIENIRSGRPRILFWTCRFTTALQYHTRDCMQAAKRLGCETELLIEKNSLDCITGCRIMKMLAQFKPDIIFSIDYFRSGHGVDIPEEVIFLTWVQDKLPQSTGNEELIRKLGNRDIVVSPFISDLQGKHWNMNYEMDVLKMPLSANTDIYKERELSKQEKEQYTCDICYVANASDYRRTVESYKTDLPAWMHEDFQMVMDVYFQLMENEVFFYGYENNLEALKNILKELKINWPAQLVSRFAEEIAIWISYSRYKSLVVEWLLEAGYTNIKLYGKEWENDEKFKPYAMGVIENGEKLSKALQASKIVLGVHPTFSLPARVMEAIASGAFCIVNDIPEADIANAREYFEEGTELVYYYGKKDFIQKVGYYLDHEDERKKVIAAGRHKIVQKLTYESIWKRLFQEIVQLVEEREKQE